MSNVKHSLGFDKLISNAIIKGGLKKLSFYSQADHKQGGGVLAIR